MFCIQVNAVSNATHMIMSKASRGGGQLEVQVIKEGDPTDSNINCSTRSIYTKSVNCDIMCLRSILSLVE